MDSLFIHVPKTGGNSVAHALLPWVEDRIISNRPWQDGYDRFQLEHGELHTSKHRTYHEYLGILGDAIDDLLVFATVRDPWSRMLSFYYSPHRQVTSWDRADFVELICRTPSTLAYLTLDGSDDAKSLQDLGTDLLLRFDHLEEDFSRLCDDLGVDARFPRVNKSDRPSLPEVYDAELVEIVADRFESEIRLFDFEAPRAADA